MIMKRNRYFVKDESFDNVSIYDKDLPQDWKLDEDGDFVYECSSIYEWIDSIIDNLYVALEYEDYTDINTAITCVIIDLIEKKSVSINAFTYYYEEGE